MLALCVTVTVAVILLTAKLRSVCHIHERPEGTARKRFNDNKKYFIGGEDYFKVCANEIRTHKIVNISPKAHEDVTLITESGYLMLVKSFTDDLSWKVQRELINNYFRVQLCINIGAVSNTAPLEFFLFRIAF